MTTNVEGYGFRKDIIFLGELLGEHLHAIEGRKVFNVVEGFRKDCVKLYLSPNDKRLYNKIKKQLGGLNVSMLEKLVHAFSVFSLLANVAEDVMRIRMRHGEKDPLETTASRLSEENISQQEITLFFNKLFIMPVFTAHPTEVQRQSLLHCEEVLKNALLDRGLNSNKNADYQRISQIKAMIATLWATRVTRINKLSVRDEINNACTWYNKSLYEVMPQVQMHCARIFNISGDRPFLRIGHWPGGDRDGNPFVTSEDLLYAVSYHRKQIKQHYLSQLDKLHVELPISANHIYLSQPLRELIKNSPERDPHRQDEPYRLALRAISHTLSNDGYKSPHAFSFDVIVIKESLIRNGLTAIADQLLTPLIKTIDTFGFHLASLDTRQSATMHQTLLCELLQTKTISNAFLMRVITKPPRIPRTRTANLRGELKKEFAIFTTMHTITSRYGNYSLGSCIISNCESETDMLVLLALLTITHPERDSSLVLERIVPLFESIAALAKAPEILNSYLSLLRKNNVSMPSEIEVMLGYSDSNKDGGMFASGFHIFQASRSIYHATTGNYSIPVRFFHGRGGSTSRGGGPTNLAIRSQPNITVSGRIRYTEQGEVISSKYNHPTTAFSNLSLVISAMLESEFLSSDSASLTQKTRQRHYDIAELISTQSADAYRKLVYGNPYFPDYFYQTTPLPWLGLLNLGSRPVVRGSKKQLATPPLKKIRAIPWVFAFAQARIALPAWYGLGSGLKAGIDAYGIKNISAMYKKWPFFKMTLSNAEMALAKTNLTIAKNYSQLMSNKRVANQIWRQIEDEYHLTTTLLHEITHHKQLLNDNIDLKQSLEHRSPYINALSYLQYEILTRIKKNETPTLTTMLLISIHGLASALRNTG